MLLLVLSRGVVLFKKNVWNLEFFHNSAELCSSHRTGSYFEVCLPASQWSHCQSGETNSAPENDQLLLYGWKLENS